MVDTCALNFTPEPWCGKHLNDHEPNSKSVYNYSNKNVVGDKTPMCKVAELARFNKLKHEYILLDEDGPAHKKRFTVRLKLCEGQIFEGSGASIKKAQQAAAAEALNHCTLPQPPSKPKKNKKDASNPCILISHVAHQLGYSLAFKDHTQRTVIPPSLPPIPNFHNMPQNRPYCFPPRPPGPPGPYPLLSMPPPRFFARNFVPPMMMNCFPRPLMNPENPSIQFKTVLSLSDGSEHHGEGRSKTEARCDAATKGLHHLFPKLTELEANLAKMKLDTNSSNSSESSVTSVEEGDNKENTDAIDELVEAQQEPQRGQRNKQKSVVSQLHECALRLRMNVEFEVLLESGEAHKRKYVMRCKLSSESRDPIIVDGEGSSKKNAKQDACKKMLEELKGLESDPVYLASLILMTNKRSTTVSKEPKRKTIIKDMKMDPQYGHHINPISRLIQVMQTLKMPEPVFTLVSEQGQNRYKEFTVQVLCQGSTLTGTGPNKKLAKRAAAEAMLKEIGYIKPMPQPGKSLLKKKSGEKMSEDGSVDIGVFDPNEVKKNEEIECRRNGVIMMETFADVDNSIKDESEKEKEKEKEKSNPESPEIQENPPASPKLEDEPGKLRKRRVTFSNQVSACPPPEDSNYPEASIAPLKSEVVIVTKPKKRGKDSKRSLSAEEKMAIAQLCRDFLAYPMAREEKQGYVSRDMDCGQFQVPVDNAWLGPAIKTAKERLESLATSFKFTVAYSDFPKDENEPFFSLVTLGLEKPIVQHGSGDTEELAHNDAAFNVIQMLTELDAPSVPLP
ncbi:hypothetical protein FO519_008563 [Halicephalobus sp. NKZ332]|nr:hypothetical protein FO519_008563 [Halicephalobus sp. NKZ332]